MAARRRTPSEWDLAYAMPGFLPQGPGVRVLHQATHHPDIVRSTLAEARLRAGGGRGFLTAREARHQVRELQSATLIRTESTAVHRELLAHGVEPGRLVHVPPGVDLDRFRPAKKRERLQIAFVGTLSLWKGVDVLVRLARAVRPWADVVVAGGPVCPWSRRLVSDAPLLQINEAVPELLGAAHALVLPSVTDGFGYVVLEAMAAGAVPFVTPAVGAADDVRRLDEALVQPREVFVDAVVELLKTLPLADLSVRARQLVQSRDRSSVARTAARALLDAAAGR